MWTVDTMTYRVRPSTHKNKKWMVTLLSGRVIHFGDSEYEDYTTHGDVKRRRNYIIRHASNEDWADPETAGFWSRWLLWEKNNIADAVADMRRRIAPASLEFRD